MTDDRELTDDELLEIWESTTAGVRDGTMQTFSDKASLVEHLRQRLDQEEAF